MKNIISHLTRTILFSSFALLIFSCSQVQDNFPDGTPIPDWFFNSTKLVLEDLGEQFVITEYGAVEDSSVLNTAVIQQIIDMASEKGGVVVIPQGTFLTGALFFKPGTHLHLMQGARLKGSNDISNFPLQPSRMEGQNLDYFPAV